MLSDDAFAVCTMENSTKEDFFKCTNVIVSLEGNGWPSLSQYIDVDNAQVLVRRKLESKTRDYLGQTSNMCALSRVKMLHLSPDESVSTIYVVVNVGVQRYTPAERRAYKTRRDLRFASQCVCIILYICMYARSL